jgi:NAD+ synthase (glutamine-hydrolysing)
MRIALAQQNYHIGHFEGNLQKMLAAVEEARSKGADLVCFPELAVCGYPARDFLEFDDFIQKSYASVEALREASRGIGIVVGSPTRNPLKAGKDLYNSAYFLYDGRVIGRQNKALLPTYDIFDEYRYFEPEKDFHVIEFKGKKVALVVCEDIWNVGNENPLYTVCPLDEMMPEKPDFIINISASPFDYDHAAGRIAVIRANVERYKIPMFYVNHTGAQTDIVFDGGSVVMSADGLVYDEMPYFEEAIGYYDLEDVQKGGRTQEQAKDKPKLIHDALVLGIRDYFGKLGFKKAILGLSGGIDSAVTAVLAAKALGADNVRVLLMPSQFSSDHSVNDARQLADNLGIQYDIVPISDMYQGFEEALKPHFWGQPFNVTEENIQARIRGILLMALSNKYGNILLNTTNKSEMAVGYGTLYGDMCGGLSVLGDVYKTEVYALARYLNETPLDGWGKTGGGVIPLNSLEKPPSAELRPGQKDSDSLPPYDVLDPLLYQYIEMHQGPRELVETHGFDETLVKRVLKMVNINEFKREQAAPVLRVSTKGFGMGRRMPIVGKYLS